MAKRLQIPRALSIVHRFVKQYALLMAWLAGHAVAEMDVAPSFNKKDSIGDLVFIQGAIVEGITLPAASGGNINPDINQGELSDYSFDPARLPPGLTFNRFTRVLSGIPTFAAKKRSYRLWIHDDDENWAITDADFLQFSIEITGKDGQIRDPLPHATQDAQPTYPVDFSASFESELQWFDKHRAPAFSKASVWNLSAWRGERVHRQILVVGSGAQDRLSISASDLESTEGHRIPAEAVSFRYPNFVIGDVESRDCEGFEERSEVSLLSDALGNTPEDLPRSYPSMIWAWLDVPHDAAPADYVGEIRIDSRSGAQTRLRIMLRVVPWTVPPPSERRFHLDLWQFPVSILDRLRDANPMRTPAPWSEAHYALLEPFYQYLAGLGQRASSTYIKEGAMGAPSMIRWMSSAGGKSWTFDYSAFDRHVERLAAWGIDSQINAFSVVGWNKDDIPFWDSDTSEHKVFHAPVGSQMYNALWNTFLTDFKRHLREKGWFEKTVLYMDEVPQEQMEAAVALIRFNDEAWKIGLAYGHAPDARVVRSLYDVSGYYESEIDVQTYDHQLTTFYTSCSLTRPNNYVAADADPADMAALPWYAMAREHDGYLRWAFDNWKSYDPLDLRDGKFTAGDFSFVYRSSNDLDMTVVPSVRSELLRDGIEDFEKLMELRQTLAGCGDGSARLVALREAVGAFTTEALMAGHAEALLAKGRALIERLSSEIDPLDCPG